MKDGSRTVEVKEETLRTLSNFADNFGDEYGTRDVYLAVEDARESLGDDDPTPYMAWRDTWGKKPFEA